VNATRRWDTSAEGRSSPELSERDERGLVTGAAERSEAAGDHDGVVDRGSPPALTPTTPATPYDLRDTFASNALAAGVAVFELARAWGQACG
jgi:hypothetical protein